MAAAYNVFNGVFVLLYDTMKYGKKEKSFIYSFTG